MNTKQFSNRQEKNVAKALGGRKQPNSGATPFFKGDVATKFFLIECKTSIEERKSYSVQRSDLNKINEEKFAMGKNYATLAFNFGPKTENHYIITESAMKDFIELLERANEQNNY
jgi:hypothetical protein